MSFLYKSLHDFFSSLVGGVFFGGGGGSLVHVVRVLSRARAFLIVIKNPNCINKNDFIYKLRLTEFKRKSKENKKN